MNGGGPGAEDRAVCAPQREPEQQGRRGNEPGSPIYWGKDHDINSRLPMAPPAVRRASRYPKAVVPSREPRKRGDSLGPSIGPRRVEPIQPVAESDSGTARQIHPGVPQLEPAHTRSQGDPVSRRYRGAVHDDLLEVQGRRPNVLLDARGVHEGDPVTHREPEVSPGVTKRPGLRPGAAIASR